MDQSEETSALPTGCCYLVVEVTSEVLPRCPAEVRLRVERRWESDTPQAALQVHLPLALTDFLRPAQLSVEEFESIWTELPTQQDSQLTPASPYTSSLDTLTHFLTASLRFSSIRVLGTEVLGAGQFQGSPSRVCLVRALWNPSTNSVITMKARDPQLLNDLFCFLNTLNT